METPAVGGTTPDPHDLQNSAPPSDQTDSSPQTDRRQQPPKPPAASYPDRSAARLSTSAIASAQAAPASSSSPGAFAKVDPDTSDRQASIRAATPDRHVEGNDRIKRQTEPPPSTIDGCLDPGVAADWDPWSRTENAFARTASGYFVSTNVTLRNALQLRVASTSSPIYNHCTGLSTTVLNMVLNGGHPDLIDAVADGLVPGLQNPQTRPAMLQQIQNNQRIFHSSGAVYPPVGDYRPAPASVFNRVTDFVNDLLDRFQRPVLRQDNRGFSNTQFAVVQMQFRNGIGHTISIQQLGEARNYPNNQYEVYDSNFGVYRYPNFNALRAAFDNLDSDGYGMGGIDRLTYTSYSYQPAGSSRSYPAHYPSSPSSGSSSSSPSSSESSSLCESGSSSSCSSGTSSSTSTDSSMSPLQSPENWANFETTLRAYGGSASASSTFGQLRLARETYLDLPRELGPGLPATALQMVTRGAQPDLAGAVGSIISDLRNPERRPITESIVRQHGRESDALNNAPENLAGYDLHPGEQGQSATGLIAGLRAHFSQPQVSSDGRGLETQPFAIANLSFGNGANQHPVVIQHVHPSDNYLNDPYQLYDANVGTLTYSNFEGLARGLNDLYAHGYPEFGGVRIATTFYYSDRSSRVDFPGVGRAPEQLAIHNIADVLGNEPDAWHVPPDAHLPPLPDFDMPGPSGYISGFGSGADRRRATFVPSLQPKAVFRPSLLSPEQLEQQKGFRAPAPTLDDINLNLHNYKMAADPADIDGGGYLATFYDRDIAQSHLQAMGDSGFIYYLAPSYNMVDTMDSLGAEHTRTGKLITQNSQEAAAMSWIDSSQIRGWQRFENGHLGNYEANPRFQWSIYDQTRTSGARPELAHFAADNAAWSDPAHAPFVKAVTEHGRTVYRPNEDPAATSARFIIQALNSLQRLTIEQRDHLEYRGPVTLRPYWDNQGAEGATRLTFRDGSVSVNNSSTGNSDEQFYLDSDGRLHSTHDYGKVLRIDGNGNAYIGAVPSESNSLNGVFRYDKARGTYWGTLTHREDGKLLTEGIAAYTPYVAKNENPNLPLQRAMWTLRDPAGHDVQPPLPRSTFRGHAGLDENLLYQFYHDPNVALPKGATHFVTRTPDLRAGNFSDYPGKSGAADGRAAINRSTYDWLRRENAALLFRDGYYATADATKRGAPLLEIRRIDGTPIWSVSFVPPEGPQTITTYGASSVASNYRIPEAVWSQVDYENANFQALLDPLPTPPSAAAGS